MKLAAFRAAILWWFLALSTALAQEDPAGSWYGVLAAPEGEIPLVLTIWNGHAGLEAALESPSQAPGRMIPVSRISIEDGHLRFESEAINATYEADWNEDEQRWAGIFSQGGGLPLAFSRTRTEPLPAGADDVPTFAFAPGSDDAAFRAAIQRLAGELIGAYEESDPARYLSTLFRLQLASGDHAGAKASLEKLAELYRTSGTRPPETLIGSQIYAAARTDTALNGTAPDEALKGAFDALYAGLDPKRALVARDWLRVDLERSERDFNMARAALTGGTITLPDALNLVRRYQFNETWQYLVPRIGPWLQADIERRYIVQDDLLIPTPDGARIAAIVIRPRAVPAPLVTLLNFTIYAEDSWSFADALKMAAYGYAGMVAYTRGKGRSPGDPVPYEHDGDDARAVIDWITQQPWSDGRVGMFSGSYNAFTQWSAAKKPHAALKAMATNASNAPGIDTPMQGNIFQNFVYPWPFFVTNTKGLDFANYGDAERWNRVNHDWYVAGAPYRSLPEFDREPNPVFSKWLEHPAYDAYWQAMLPYGEEFAQIDIPVFVQTGYFDGGVIGALYYMRQHLKHNPDADHRMIIGPYHHFAMQSGPLRNVEGYDVDPAALVDLQEIRLGWFDHVFKGAPMPALLKDQVNFQVMGADTWRHAPSLAAMGDERLRFYLGEQTPGGVHALPQTRPQGRSGGKLVVDLADRSDADYEPPAAFPGPAIDTRNALVYESAPLEDVAEVDGFFTASLEFMTNKKDVDLRIAVYEGMPDGNYFPLFYYIGRASYAEDRSERHLLEPERRTRLSIEGEWLVGKKLEQGSRLVAIVGILKTPDAQINYGTGADVSDESIANAGDPLTIEWLNGSFIEIPIRR